MKRNIATFVNSAQVVRASKLCRENAIAIRIIPTPTTLSSECGMAIEILNDMDLPKFKELFKQATIYESI